MATSLASDKPIAASSAGDGFDPFVTSPGGQTHLRHSTFDSQLFALSPGMSAEQVKRAIEAHLKDTERRMEEAGKLGTALVQQRKELTDRLREVEELQSEGEPGQELRQRLAEIEREYNDVARETARAFLPKQRIPSNEGAQGSPFAPEGKGGRRSVSPSKFESMATASPTKFSVPNRKLRNQPANRIHDIEFAAEISTSLISQVRNLQALLAEREEELKDLKVERSKLEDDAERFQQQVKNLDESESRYKDENWNLEMRMRELEAEQKESADREKKLQQSFNIMQAEKTATQRELEEVKDNLAKQDEKHASAIKNLEIELGTSRRNAAILETERSTMQRKVEELTSQNQELAKAFSMQRARAAEREAGFAASEEEFMTATDNGTPDHSPPASPVKGTPRHSALESETLKTSLQHAQRTIQTLRTNIHREKTEKLELKRMLQDARDDLEKLRTEPAAGNNKRSKKTESKETKKPFKLGQLGSVRASKTELYVDEDPEWEEVESQSAAVLSPGNSTLRSSSSMAPVLESASDHFETANETSDAAFETAHERGTETEDFQTGVEEMSDDDAATETEASPSKGSSRMKRPPVLPMSYGSNRYSFDSTASTSDDNEDYSYGDARTPTAPKMRLRVSRGALVGRRSRQFSEEPALQSSPVSFVASSTSGTPKQGGQSLFAELGDMEDGSDNDSYVGGTTPSRRSIRSVTRGRLSPAPEMPPMPRVIMVDSSTMTEPVQVNPLGASPESEERDDEILSPQSVIFTGRPMSMASVVDARQSHASTQWLGSDFRDEFSRPLSTFSYSDASVQNDTDLESKLAQFPAPPTSPPKMGLVPTPILSPPQSLGMSDVQSEHIEPFEIDSTPPLLSVSTIISEDTEPISERPVTPPAFSMSSVAFEHLEPRPEPEVIPPPLTMSSLLVEDVEPKPEPEVIPPPLVMSSLLVEDVEPKPEPEAVPPPFSLSSLHVQHVEPLAEPEPPLPTPPELSMAALVSQDVEPIAEPEAPMPVPAALSISSIQAEQVEPVELPPVSPILAPQLEHKVVVPPPVSLALSTITAEHVEPREPVVSPVQLSFVPINTKEVEPRQEPLEAPAAFSLSTIEAQNVEPFERPASPLPTLEISTVASQEIEPLLPEEPTFIVPTLSASLIQSLESEPIEAVIDEPPLSVAPILSLESEPIEAVSDEPFVAAAPLSVPSILSLASEPISPRSPKRNGFIIPRDEAEKYLPQALSHGSGDNDERKTVATADQGAQTSLTSEALDQILAAKSQPSVDGGLTRSESIASFGTPSTVRIHRPRQASIDSTSRSRPKMADAAAEMRPSSSASTRGSLRDLPPLPANHKEAIEAARTGSSSGGAGTMGPPLFPASALKAQTPRDAQAAPFRPRTPNDSKRPMSPLSVASGRGTPTPRAARGGSAQGTHEVVRSPTLLTQHSRKSSVSSFASELDSRFNMQHPGGFEAHGFGPNTDPRMIQAITSTMIGEYLWKYTRKAGGQMSDNRHRRYFWVHPYTRTLYWSDRDPSNAGRSELRAKSVQIEAVRVVTDDNIMPPGLHRKSLVIISPSRTVKFTCTTGQRHETWFNALSYLLLRTNDESHTDAEEMAGSITREDVEEFNPGYGRRVPNGTRIAPSLSSHTSRTVRTESPAVDFSMDIPTLTPRKSAQGRPSSSTLSRISGYWKDNGLLSGTFGSLRSRSVSGRDPNSIYEASEVQDSAEDLRQMIERQDREADRLENVRSCCDGKHDVGTLTSSSKRGLHPRGHIHTHNSHSGPSVVSTPAGTVQSRA